MLFNSTENEVPLLLLMLRNTIMAKQRYAAKLIFQFRIDSQDDSGKYRICETRFLNYFASTASEAYQEGQKKGKAAEYEYINDEGFTVYFEFIGLMELLKLTPECESDEVWYEVSTKLLPMERKERLIPRKESLNAFKHASHKPK